MLNGPQQLGKLFVWDVYGSAGAGVPAGTIVREVYSALTGGGPHVAVQQRVYGQASSPPPPPTGTIIREVYSILCGGSPHAYVYCSRGQASAGPADPDNPAPTVTFSMLTMQRRRGRR